MKKITVILVFSLTLLDSLVFANFSDVPSNHWAYEAVTELSKHGIVTGLPDGTFQGNQSVTRFQPAVSLYRVVIILKTTA